MSNGAWPTAAIIIALCLSVSGCYASLAWSNAWKDVEIAKLRSSQ